MAPSLVMPALHGIPQTCTRNSPTVRLSGTSHSCWPATGTNAMPPFTPAVRMTIGCCRTLPCRCLLIASGHTPNALPRLWMPRCTATHTSPLTRRTSCLVPVTTRTPPGGLEHRLHTRHSKRQPCLRPYVGPYALPLTPHTLVARSCWCLTGPHQHTLRCWTMNLFST